MNYIKIPKHFVESNVFKKMNGTTLKVLLVVMSKTDVEGKSCPSYTEIQKTSGLSRATVSVSLKYLINSGIIFRAGTGERNLNLYRISF